MIVDFKYHVTTLVSVFMALGIGIGIGSLLVGESFVTSVLDEQEVLVQRLEVEFLNLKSEAKLQKDEIEVLKYKNEYYKQYADYTLPQLISGCLDGKKIVLLESKDVQTPEDFLGNLKISGVEVIHANKLLNDAGLEDGDYATYISLVNKDEFIKDLAAIIQVSSNLSEQKAFAQKIPTTITQSLRDEGIDVYNLIVGVDYEKELASNKEEVYFITEGDSIPEQVALILAISGGSYSRPAEKVAGF
ncbi:MAG: hypothetical protein CVU87_06240 [Firmicutes bacterium HGW-Firmicutes-12]|jgi:hypothetical protein|nr:MAG: hypothetical protein CVU87_06240 [Firmicutes bacterium HGW-Firmicutes-12]